MFSNGLYKLRALGRRPWVRVALFSLAAMFAALAAASLQGLIPPEIAESIGSEAVEQILSILATSMLPVATFSLTTMVQAYGSATTNVTPRAVQLLTEDTRAQTALATFVGAFVYSVVGLIALKTDYYGAEGRVVVFVVTLVVLAAVVATLVRWIETLSTLGRVGSTIDIIEKAASAALARRARLPNLGGVPPTCAVGTVARIVSDATGYIQHIDTGGLIAMAERCDLRLHLVKLPGSFVHPGEPLAEVVGALDDSGQEKIRSSFVIGDRRHYDDDPRFGIIVLSEVASRALSPAINDPGTAIDVIGTLVRILGDWSRLREEGSDKPACPRLSAADLTAAELFDDGFTPIARDGAAIVEVGIRLQKAFTALASCGQADVAEAARKHAVLALARSRQAMTLADDVRAVEAACGEPSGSSARA